MKTTRWGLLLLCLPPLLVTEDAAACRFTPLEWQQPVKEHKDRAFIGQAKLTRWVRDGDGDFIDDEIRTRFRSGDHVNVIVDLNRCIPADVLNERFAHGRYGRLTYIGRLVTYVMLRGVPVDALPLLAARPEVAMIEWQAPMRSQNDVSSRAVQARLSTSYGNQAAEALGGGGFSGKNIIIAIVDEGVDDSHAAFKPGKFKGGFDAFNPAITNPAGSWHGTQVASVAMGARTGPKCRPLRPPDNEIPGDCAGVARDAQLVDVRACCPAGDELEKIGEALDWLAIDGKALGVDVVNISIGNCVQDDGKSAVPQHVDTLVSTGVTVVIGHGNSSGCSGVIPGQVLTMAPGSSSLAITVAASNDMGTVNRSGDMNYPYHLSGPRSDYSGTLEPAALKPDLAAPGTTIFSAIPNSAFAADDYDIGSGTSLAAPHVAGAAAILLEARPKIGPGSLKELLKRTADPLTGAPSCDPALPTCNWQPKLGSGILNVHAALAASTTDVRFPTCIADTTVASQPCTRTAPLFSWANDVDVLTSSPPVAGQLNTITAKVTNSGQVDAIVDVKFGVYQFAIGNKRFYHVGTKRVLIASGDTVHVHQPWTPSNDTHQCIQVSIDFGLDSDFSNNITQRNVQVTPALAGMQMQQLQLQVENPLMSAAKIVLTAKPERAGWACRLSDTAFVLDPLKDCPRLIDVLLEPPPGVAAGESANCNITATAAPRGGLPQPIGGVTVRHVVPKPCRIVGMVVDESGRPLADAIIDVRPAAREKAHDADPPRPAGAPSGTGVGAMRLTTDQDGIFDAKLAPHVRYVIAIEKADIGRGEIVTWLDCGARQTKFVLSRAGVTEWK